MKKSQIIGIVFIAVLLGALTTSLSSSGKMANFTEAFANSDREYRVSGFLVDSEPITYDPHTNASLTSFTMRDQEGELRKVNLLKSMPQGFAQSESLVLTGSANGEVFEAKDMLMKCPSKYNEDQHMMADTPSSSK